MEINSTSGARRTKICPHCKKEVDYEATRCFHCQGKMHVWTRNKKLVAVFFGIVIFGGFISSAFDSSSPTPAKSQAPTMSKEAATKELKELMETMFDAKVAHSYEFSETKNVVYINPVWYTLKVDFKKDILAEVSQLKHAITGYKHFEVRDANSNEKVAEVTAFSGSLEVYK